MCKSSSRRIHESWSKQFDKKFAEKKVSRKLLSEIDWEIKNVCKKLDYEAGIL